MNSLDKALSILSLFDDETAVVTHEAVEALTGASRSSAYRYLQSLTDVGLLVQSSNGAYSLGARILELDRLQRRSDGLLLAAKPLMAEAGARLGYNLVLSRYYGNRVICSHTNWPDKTLEPIYERGKPLPLFYGAMAKVILANLTPYQLRSLMLRHVDEIRKAGLGDDWKQFRVNMTRLRKQRACVTLEEIAAGSVGVGAALFDGDQRVVGSIVFAIPRPIFDAADEAVVRSEIIGVADRIMLKLNGPPAMARSAPAASEDSAKAQDLPE
jgi:DNA-binding IclR family transcriptional regulator